MVFGRPELMVPELEQPCVEIASTWESFAILYSHVYNSLYGCSDGAYYNKLCPFEGRIFTLISQLSPAPTTDTTVSQTWLLFVPICLEHKQCLQCFQEIDDDPIDTIDESVGNVPRGMSSLRSRIVKASSDLLSETYKEVCSANGNKTFIPPILACIQAFSAGCALAIASRRKWGSFRTHTFSFRSAFIMCTEILALTASHWPGGRTYLETWRLVVANVHP